jgi:hypothetical protein
MSNIEILSDAGLVSAEMDASERAAIESLTPDEIEALLNAPAQRGRTEIPTFHVAF